PRPAVRERDRRRLYDRTDARSRPGRSPRGRGPVAGARHPAGSDRTDDRLDPAAARQSRPMKAAVIYENGGADVLRYEDVPDPPCPDGCVVVDADAISIEGGDLLARARGDLPSVPHIVGYLSAGTVSEVAPGVADRAVGDRVVALNFAGSHAARR